MPYVSREYDKNSKAPKGKYVGVFNNVFFSGGIADFKANAYYGECVTYVKAVIPDLAHKTTSMWKAGDLVKANGELAAGTAIATFHGGSFSGSENHAAIYVSQDSDGIVVWDQYWDHRHKPPQDGKPVGVRQLRFGNPKYVNDGAAYHVIELRL